MLCLSAPHSHSISEAVLPPAPPRGAISPAHASPCSCHPHAHVILCPHGDWTTGTCCHQTFSSVPLQAGPGLAPQCGFWKAWSWKDLANYLPFFFFNFIYFFNETLWSWYRIKAFWHHGMGKVVVWFRSVPHTLPDCIVPSPSLQPYFHFIVNTMTSPDVQTERKYQK